jgi:hypothetical protein
MSKRNTGKPKVCRIASLKDFGGVIIGRDMGDILKEGHVYSVVELMGQIIITDLGEHAQPEWLGSNGTVSQYVTSGVPMLTKAEYRREKEAEG